jgi:preprotein translocase subunit SecE
MTNPFLKVRDFLNEVMAELKKSSWPTRKELVDSTIVVIITVLVLGMFVALADVVFLRIIGFLTKAA